MWMNIIERRKSLTSWSTSSCLIATLSTFPSYWIPSGSSMTLPHLCNLHREKNITWVILVSQRSRWAFNYSNICQVWKIMGRLPWEGIGEREPGCNVLVFQTKRSSQWSWKWESGSYFWVGKSASRWQHHIQCSYYEPLSYVLQKGRSTNWAP